MEKVDDELILTVVELCAGDTRETPAIDVCKGLMEEGAKLKIYDPQVSFDQIQMDLSLNKFEWDGPAHTLKAKYVLFPLFCLGMTVDET